VIETARIKTLISAMATVAGLIYVRSDIATPGVEYPYMTWTLLNSRTTGLGQSRVLTQSATPNSLDVERSGNHYDTLSISLHDKYREDREDFYNENSERAQAVRDWLTTDAAKVVLESAGIVVKDRGDVSLRTELDAPDNVVSHGFDLLVSGIRTHVETVPEMAAVKLGIAPGGQAPFEKEIPVGA